MIATHPVNRLGYDSPPLSRPVLPKGERARGQLWSDVVFEAVLALRNQLSSRNDTVAAAAANSILEMERTRMRHAKQIAGSRYVNEEMEEFERNPSGMASDEDDDDRGDEFLTPVLSNLPHAAGSVAIGGCVCRHRYRANSSSTSW